MSVFAPFILETAPPGSGLRPFVCEGSPLECEVALVGYNPATCLDADFHGFWDGHVFDKQRWFEAYKKERRTKPLKPGKTRRNEVSPTRKRIHFFAAGVAPYKLLETNLYWDASEDRASHTVSVLSRIEEMLRMLTKIRLIVCHDDQAFDLLSAAKLPARVEKVDHFANRKPGWSDNAAYQLGVKMRALLNGFS